MFHSHPSVAKLIVVTSFGCKYPLVLTDVIGYDSNGGLPTYCRQTSPQLSVIPVNSIVVHACIGLQASTRVIGEGRIHTSFRLVWVGVVNDLALFRFGSAFSLLVPAAALSLHD